MLFGQRQAQGCELSEIYWALSGEVLVDLVSSFCAAAARKKGSDEASVKK